MTTSKTRSGLLPAALVSLAIVALPSPAAGQSLGKKAFQKFTRGVKSLWTVHGPMGQFRALTGIGTPKGFLGWRTVAVGPRGQLFDLLHGSGSYLNRQYVMKQNMRYQREVMQQILEAQQQAMRVAQQRAPADARYGESRYEPPHPGSQATWREPKWQAMGAAQRAQFRSIHPPPL